MEFEDVNEQDEQEISKSREASSMGEQRERRDSERRVAIKNLFSSVREEREEAIRELKEAWAYDDPCFNEDELATCSYENCTIMASRRDGQREVINWLTKL